MRDEKSDAAMPLLSFAKLIEPLGEKEFFADYFGQRYVHLKGDTARTQAVMDWAKMSGILSMTSVWTPATIKVVLDGNHVPAEQYCTATLGSKGQTVLRPDPEKVQAWIRRGASVVLNDIDELAPGIKQVATELERVTGGLNQANLYFSMRQRQAFGPHFDHHDVFALHCAGEKVWRIYKGREDAPINHPMYNWTNEEFRRAAGEIDQEITMQPGDMLYLPRGVYHDALASKNGAVHIAFGVTMPKLLDVLPLVWDKAFASARLRADLPRFAGDAAMKTALEQMAQEISQMVTSADFQAQAKAKIDEFSPVRANYDIEEMVKSDPVYLVAKGLSVRQVGAKSLLHHGRQSVEIPKNIVSPVTWVLERQEVTRTELGTAFPDMDGEALGELVENLVAMQVLR
ncbi:MAG: JmjC domain-containing protein [Alphaproteobacteria bacterium]